MTIQKALALSPSTVSGSSMGYMSPKIIRPYRATTPTIETATRFHFRR